MRKGISIRIIQLKNNFYRDDVSIERKALGDYCVIGYFDAFDTFKEQMAGVTKFNTWGHLGELTSQLDGSANCRMLVCVTERPEEDREFWEDQSDMLFFVTMVRVKAGMTADEMDDIIDKLGKTKKRIGYFSYDHSEIIVATKTNRYSEGIEGVRKLRNICGAVKTYTVFAMIEKFLESYQLIQEKIDDEKVFCRLHCMVKDYEKAEVFRSELEEHINSRSKEKVEVYKFDTFGGYDWLLELNNVSICSILECYKMNALLTHTNERYNEAFFNIESEILIRGGRGQNGSYVDRGAKKAIEAEV